MKSFNKSLFPACIIGFFLLSCKKMLEIAPPKNQLVSTTVFKDSSDATSAVLGIYSNIMKGLSGLNFGNGAITVNTGYSSDEIYPVNGSPSENEMYANEISPAKNLLIDWSFAYKIIYQANACIEGIDASPGLSSSLKNHLLGEAKFMRAFFYFNLVNLYGDVPFINSTDYRVNATLRRTPTDTIYNYLIADLEDAETLLASAQSVNERTRPGKYAATALLSRIYLYKKDWANAQSAASKIINSGAFYLEPDLNKVFLPSSHEAILQLVPLQPGFETAEGYKFIPSSRTIYPKCVITPVLLSAFEPSDQRRVAWLDSNLVNGQPYYFPKKYKLGRDGNSSPLEYYMLLRLAEIYLIRAEARAQLNDIMGSIEDINAIRTRSGLQNTTAPDQATLLDMILHERQTELFCEWGHRWFDLKRTGKIDSILLSEKPGWQPTDALYPIPFVEMQNNPYLLQNPGYN